MDAESIYRVMKSGTPAERIQFARSLPPDPMLDMGISLLNADRLGMRIVALSTAAMTYCNGRDPSVGRDLALALHRLAVESYEGSPDHEGLSPTTLSGLAHGYIKACNLLGQSADAVTFADKFIPYYDRFEQENIRSIKLSRIEALLNLNRVDDAKRSLDDPKLPGDPVSDIAFERLRRKIAALTKSPTDDRSSAAQSTAMSSDELLKYAHAAIAKLAGGDDKNPMAALLTEIAGANVHRSLDPSKPDDFSQLLGVLDRGDAFLRRGNDGDSELSVRQRIRNASGLFVTTAKPPAEAIRASLGELVACLSWSESQRMVELQNDSLWGIYLCHSRLDAPSAAADALIRLRSNLEATRSAITDPMQRGGVFTAYPYLFAALCEKLYRADRILEMLEAIEASKGRAVADLLTLRNQEAVADSSINDAIAKIPDLCRQYGFHYLTYFVDEQATYSVLVNKAGQLTAQKPIPLSRATIRKQAALGTAEAGALTSLLEWLPALLADGVIAQGDHVCIAADDDLANVPFGCLPVNARPVARPLADLVSISRIHNAFQLARLFNSRSKRPAAYLGVVVPSTANVRGAKWKEMREYLHRPIVRLAEKLTGAILDGSSGSLSAVTHSDLRQRVVHFSTHGDFPEADKGRLPFDYAGLLLSNGADLPDTEAVDHDSVLSPRYVFEKRLQFDGSHVSMMACVSGLSREGVGGDALGMEWALIQAGAASVLSTHWSVRASNAAEFIDTFYKHWIEKKKTRAKALKDTIVEIRSAGGEGANPASWAAFSLTGDWR